MKELLSKTRFFLKVKEKREKVIYTFKITSNLTRWYKELLLIYMVILTKEVLVS